MASLYSRLTYSALTASLLLAPLAGRAQETITTQPATLAPTPAASPSAASSPAATSPADDTGTPPPRALDDDRYTPPATTTSTAPPVAPVSGATTETAGAPSSVTASPAPPISAPVATPLAPAVAAPTAAPTRPTPTPSAPARHRAPASEPQAKLYVKGPVVTDADGSRPVKVGDGDTVNVIAKRLAISSEALISANKLKKPYDLDVGQTLKAPTPKDYVIQTGDTLSGVSRRFGVSPALLGELNGFDVRERLHAGQKIALPAGFHDAAARSALATASDSSPPASEPLRAPDDSEPTSSAAPVAPTAPMTPITPVAPVTSPSAAEPSHPIPYSQTQPPLTASPAPAAPSAQAEPSASPEPAPPQPAAPEVRLSVQGKVITDRQKFREMRVGAGDTVNVIAERLLTAKDDLITLNHLKKPYELDRGRVLKIPTPTAYVAEGADTLAQVAKRFGTTPAVLAEINDMDETDRLRSGQKIALPTEVHDSGPVRTVIAPMRGPSRYPYGGEEPYGARPMPPSRLSPPSSYGEPPAADVSPAPTDAQIIAAGKGRFAWPARGQLLSGFGPKAGGQRNDGMDIAASLGTPVTAAADGDVVYAGNLVPGFGNLVLIRHEDGWVTAYAYLQRIGVKIRDHVRQGDEIGEVGQTGGVDQPQLHFEIRYAPTPKDKARPVDPTLVLPSR